MMAGLYTESILMLSEVLLLQYSKRILETDDPIMVQNTRLLGGAKDVSSLGQGQQLGRLSLNQRSAASQTSPSGRMLALSH